MQASVDLNIEDRQQRFALGALCESTRGEPIAKDQSASTGGTTIDSRTMNCFLTKMASMMKAESELQRKLELMSMLTVW